MEKLEKYITGIVPANRDAVLDQIVRNRLIKDALDTTQGNALLNTIIDTIAEKTRAIVGCCTIDSTEDQTERMQRLATEIHVAFNLMKDWAGILVAGKVHEEAMEKKAP